MQSVISNAARASRAMFVLRATRGVFGPGMPGPYIRMGAGCGLPVASTLPQATPAIAAQCAPFPGSTGAGIAGTCENLLGNAGRNSIVGSSLINLDFALYKNFGVRKISESFNVQFRAEFFNVLNHANFLPPTDFQNSNTTQLFNQNGTPTGAGGLTTLSTLPRVIQFALKAIF